MARTSLARACEKEAMRVINLPALLLALLMTIAMPACVANETVDAAPAADALDLAAGADTGTAVVEEEFQMGAITLTVAGRPLTVEWQDNASVDALRELLRTGPLTISLSMYGGFEQVGSLGANLPRNDVQTTTEPGDIVLYSGNQIVLFYGSNSWAYTRLGKIIGLNRSELEDLLGNGDVTAVLSLADTNTQEETVIFDFNNLQNQ